MKNWLCLMILSLALAACGNPQNSGPTLGEIVATDDPCDTKYVETDKFESNNTRSDARPVGGNEQATLYDLSKDVDYYKVTNNGKGGYYSLGYSFKLLSTDTPLTLTWYDFNGTNYTKVGSKTFSDCQPQVNDEVSIPKYKTYIFEVKSNQPVDYACTACSQPVDNACTVCSQPGYNFWVGEKLEIPPHLKEYLPSIPIKEAILYRIEPDTSSYCDPDDPCPWVLVGQSVLYLVTKSERFDSLALDGTGIHLTLFDSEGKQLDKGRAAFDDTGLQTGETLSLSTVEAGQDYILAVERLLTDKVSDEEAMRLPVLHYLLKGIR
jgi:hypothetical protein